MKLLIITHEFPPIGGGAASIVEYIARYFSQKRYDVEVITSSYSNMPKVESRDEYRIYRIPAIRKRRETGTIFSFFSFFISGLFCLPLYIRKNRPEMVLAFFSFPGGGLAFFLKCIARIPYIIFLRGFDVPGAATISDSLILRLIKTSFFKPFFRALWSNAAQVVVNSRVLESRVKRILTDKEITIIPNGIDTILFCQNQIKKVDDKIKLLFAGRLNIDKGLSYLLKAIALLNSGLTDRFTVEIAGDGPQRPRLKKMAEILNIQDKINFLGWVKRSDIITVYQRADIFIFPSMDESMPNAVMEAMACGLALVVSDIPAHKELIEDGKNGLLIPPGDSQALADGIRLLITDKSLRERMGQENLKKARNYSWQNIYKYLEKLRIEDGQFNSRDQGLL